MLLSRASMYLVASSKASLGAPVRTCDEDLFPTTAYLGAALHSHPGPWLSVLFFLTLSLSLSLSLALALSLSLSL